MAISFKIKPWEHQARAIEFFKKHTRGFLFFEVGTGKTSTAINILREKYTNKKRMLRTLIVSPPVTLNNWVREWGMHSNIKPEDQVILYGTEKKRHGELLQKGFLEGKRIPRVFITNYESLLMDDLYALLKMYEPEAIVFDEVHKIKNPGARRTKRAISIADGVPIKLGLTGTPILNSAMDIFSPFLAIDGGETFGKNFFVFRNTYFYDRNASMPKQKHFPDWRMRTGVTDELKRKISALSVHAKKAECLDLPPYLRVVKEVELSVPQRKLYTEMAKNFLTFIEGEAVSASLAITKALRLQQIASGFVKTEEGNEIAIGDNPRKALLQDLLEQLTPDHKVIVWAVFKENYHTIADVCKALKIKYVEVHGEVPPSQRQVAVDSFETDAEVRVFIGHPGSGGIGINLVSASYSIFYSRNMNLEYDLQAEARNYRGGSEKHEKITRIDIIARDTIDEIVAESLAKKEDLGHKLVDHLKHKLKEQIDG